MAPSFQQTLLMSNLCSQPTQLNLQGMLDPTGARLQLHTGVVITATEAHPPSLHEGEGWLCPTAHQSCHPALQTGTSKARLRQEILPGGADTGSTRLTAASRGQNTTKHSHVSNIWDVLCPFQARMVPHLYHILVSCGLALL